MSRTLSEKELARRAARRAYRARLRERKKQPMDQGCLARISKLFLEPLHKFCPDEMSIKEFTATHLFHLEERSIEKFKANEKFKMTGELRVLASRTTPGIGQRLVQAGTEMWVRRDRVSRVIEIEIHNGNGGGEQVFVLTANDYRKIRGFLT